MTIRFVKVKSQVPKLVNCQLPSDFYRAATSRMGRVTKIDLVKSDHLLHEVCFAVVLWLSVQIWKPFSFCFFSLCYWSNSWIIIRTILIPAPKTLALLYIFGNEQVACDFCKRVWMGRRGRCDCWLAARLKSTCVNPPL